MANVWNKKVTSKDNIDSISSSVPKTEFDSDVFHLNQKGWFAKVRAKVSSLDIKGYLSMFLKVVAISLPLIASLFLVREVQRRQSLKSNANAGQARLFFQVGNVSIPPETDFQLMLNADGNVGFIRTELNFDPSITKLITEVDVSASPFKKVIKLTPMESANQTGKIEIVLGLDPSDLGRPPSGNMSIANFRLDANSEEDNLQSSMQINSTNSQVVHLNMNLYTIATTNTSILINPSTAPAPQVTPTAIASPESSAVAEPNCKSCFKNRCDNVCDPKKDRPGCPDCL